MQLVLRVSAAYMSATLSYEQQCVADLYSWWRVLGYIVAVDSVSPTVFCISETGDLIRWFDCSDYMREPSDIAVSGKEYFVCDFKVSKHTHLDPF